MVLRLNNVENATCYHHRKVNSSMEKLVEAFVTELECHRRNISKEIDDVANTRINELNATLKRLEEVCPWFPRFKDIKNPRTHL